MSAIEESVKLGFLDNINIKPTISTNIYRTRQAIFDNSDLIESLSRLGKEEEDALERYTLSRMQTEEIMESVKSFYADSGIDPREESTRIEFANLIAMEHPEYSSKFLYDNLDSFIRQATGYDLNVESYWKDLGNIFQSSALSYLSSMELGLTMIFNPSNKENLLKDISRRATAYRRDLSSEDYNILQNMLASSVAQAPHLVADLGISAVGSLVGLPPGAMTALRVATAGLMEGGSSMLELAQAGADDTTILTTGIAVGVINGAFEVFGDNAILAPYQRLLKRNPAVKEAARYTWKTVGKQVAKDVVKGLVTEIPTEIAQEAVSMVGWNFATAFEQRYGRMQDALGYDKSQFVSALWEVAKETALSTPMITLSGDVMNYGTSYLNGQWRSQINASNVTRATENSQMFRSKDINVGNGEMSYISNRRDFKQEKADPIQLARIGDKLYAINPTDKQKSALKASKTVNAESADFSATRLADPRNAEVTDIGITYDKAIESIQEGFEKGMVAGYSLLDENLNETNARDNAKYIEVVTNSAKDTAAVITLGKDEDSQSSFEKKVFGKVFHNISNQQESKSDKTSKRYEEYRKSKEQQKAQEATQQATQENTQSTTQEATQEATQATSQENAQQTVQETQQATQEEIKVSPAEETRDEKVAKANEKENSLAETLEKTVPNNVDEVVQIRDSIVSNGASLEDANAAAISIANSSATTGKTIEETVKDISTDISELSRAFTAKDISSREAIVDKITSQAKSLPKKAKEKIRSAYGVDRISKAIPSLKKDLESYLSTGKAKKGLGDIFSGMERIIENTMGYSYPTEQTVDTEQRVGERLSKAEKSDTPNETLVKETKKAKEKPAEAAEYGTNADLKGKDRIGLNENGSPNISLLSKAEMDKEDFYKDVAKQFYDIRTNSLIQTLKKKKELINQGLVDGDKIGKHIEDALSELGTIFNTLKYFDFEIKDVVPHYTKLKNALEALHQSLNKGDTLESLTDAKGIQDIYDTIGAITKLRDDPYGFGEQLGFKDSTTRKNLERAIKSIKKFIAQTNDDITKGLYKGSNDRLNKALTELSNGLEEMLSNINDKEKLKTFDYNDLSNRFEALVDSITSAQLNDKDNNTLKERLDTIQVINGEFLAALKKVEDKYGQNAKTESSSETKTDDKTSNGIDNSKANAIDNKNTSEIGTLNEEINKKKQEIEALKKEYRTNTEMPYERYQEIIDTWNRLGKEIAQNEAEIARLQSIEEKSKASAELDTTKTAIASHDEAISKISESLDTGNKELDERNKETVRKLEEERETLLSESEKNAETKANPEETKTEEQATNAEPKKETISDLQKNLSEARSEEEISSAKSAIKAFGDKAYLDLKESERRLNKGAMKAIRKLYDTEKPNPFGLVKNDMKISKYVHQFERILEQNPNARTEDAFNMFSKVIFERLSQSANKLNSEYETISEKDLKTIVREYVDSIYAIHAIYENKDYLFEDSAPIDRKIQILKNLMGEGLQDYSLSSLFDTSGIKMDETMEDILADNVRARYDKLIEKAQNGDSNVRFQEALNAESVMDGSDFSPFYEPYVYQKDGLYRFDQDLLAKEITRQTEGSIGKRKAKYIARLISMMPKNDIDAIIRKNGGRLILNATEAGIDIGDHRGASILTSAQIVLSRNSDATTVIHESFHILTEIDQDLKANIWNAFKSTLGNEKEKEQLREFIGENREIFGHDADTIMDRLSLLGKETLTETESQNLDEAITSAYEAWFRSNATSRLSSGIREAFRKVAELFSEVYRTVTGKALLPETIDEAFGATLEEAEEQGKKVRFQSNKAKTVSEMILDEATREKGLDIATNIMLSKVSSEISTMLKGGDPRGISESIMGNQKVASYLESLTPEVRVLASEALQKRIAYIAQSPTVFARAFNEKIKKLETSIKRNYKWAMPTEAKEVLDVIADLWNNVRLKSSKPGYVYSSDNSQDIGIRRMVSITYDGMNVGELYDGLVESQKARGAVERSFTPREVVAMARALVNKDGSVRLDTNEDNNVISLDGKYRAPLITMLNYKVTDKTRIAELNSSSFLDKAYIDMTNILITAMQSPEVTEQFVVDQNAVDVAKFLDSAGIENWVDIIADSDEGMEIAANIADLFDEKLRQIARKISKIRKDNSSTTTNIDEMLSQLDQIKKDLASRERANENVETLRKEIRNVRKRLTEEIERNAGLEAMRKDVESGDAYKSLKDEISALKNILKETRKKATQLENGFDPRVAKLEEEISLLKNTEAYKAIMQMKMTSDAYISKMENASKGGDARIAHDLADILSAFRKKGSKDKPRLFDIGRYASNETYFGLLDFFLDKGMASEITLDDGSKAYAIEKTVRMLSLEEMAELTDLFENAKKQGEAIQAHKKNEREAEQRKKETLIINSLKGLSKMSESQRQRFIDAYMASIRPGSETYESQNKRNLIQKTMPGFVLTTKLVKHLSPALYSYMFGGVMDGEYNSVNLNSQSNKEAENVRNRTRSFISMLSSTFGVEEKNVGYAIKKLFKNELNSIGIVDADSFLDNSKDERLKALKYYKNALESEKKKLSRNIVNLEVLLSESVDENDAMSISTMIDNANARIAQINETLGDGTSSNAQYNMEQLMGIYIYAQSNDGISRLLKSDKEDVITQNLSLQNVAYVMDRFINDPGMAQYRKTAEWIMQDVGSRYDEMAEVYYQAENKVLKKEDMYFPISSMDGIYEKGDSMQLASLFSSDRGFVNDRDTKERTGARNALNLNVVDSYMSAVKRQEHYIAFKLLTDEMTPILSKDGQVARAIMAMYQEKSGKGQETVNQLYDYLETIKGKRGNYNDMNSIVSKIRNNFVVAKLWGNLSTVLQQFPTYLLVARHVGWKNAAIYLADYIGNGKNRSEMIYRLSPQMRDRARLDIETYKAGRDNAVSNLERWVESKAGRDLLGDAKVGYRRFIDFGISLMEKTDTAVANAMWWAVYNENIEEYSKTPDKYMTTDSSGNRVSILEQAAADAATQAVMDLSPNSNPKDNSLIYSNADAFWKQLLLFTNQLNKQFNMVYGDIMDLEFSEDYKEAMMPILRDLAVLGVVSMGAALISGNPWPEEDDEPEAFLAELAGYTLAEMVGNAPVVGTLLKDTITGSTYAETSLLEQWQNLRKVALKDPDKRTKHQMSRAVVNTFAETGTLFGVPTTAVQKSYRAIVESMDNPSIGNLGYLINTKQGKFFGRIME